MHFSSSENFLWSSNDSLGKGATGGVYKGRHLKTGQLVAVKVFTNETSSFWRELDILKKTPPHDNIVRFLSMESEHSTKRRVILMELCTGGSLYNVIDHPENGFGLEEKELLIVLRDVVSGLNHLHQNKIIHRDIKPGNIMRCINEDGFHSYKLVDFGAARELDPSDTFTSLYGTEEYLHPDMYERAVLRKNKGKTFTRSIDLWSIGATFYHVITGKLPFRPFLGRQDRDVMFKMTGDKKKGVISAFQLDHNGKIFWDTNLPEHIRTLPHLRLLLTCILAGILESNSDDCMTFDKFVDQIFIITSLKVITVFTIFDSSFLRIYLEISVATENWFTQLKEKVYLLTKISPSEQIYFYNNRYFHSSLGEEFPDSNESRPFYLVNLSNDSKEESFVLPPELIYSKDSLSLEKDYHSTKSALSYVYFLKRKCKYAHDSTLLIDQIASLLVSTINGEFAKFDNVNVLVTQLFSKQLVFNNICDYIRQTFSMYSDAPTEECRRLFIDIQNSRNEIDSISRCIAENIEKFKSRFSNKTKFCLSSFTIPPSLSFYTVAEKQFELQIKKLTEAQNCFVKDYKHNNIIHPLEKANHNFYKEDAYNTISQAKKLIQKVKQNQTNYNIQFLNWFECQIQPTLIIFSDLKNMIDEIEGMCTDLSKLIETTQSSLFERSLNHLFLLFQSIKLKSTDAAHGSHDLSFWSQFVQLAGPSLLSIENLTHSLPEFHNI